MGALVAYDRGAAAVDRRPGPHALGLGLVAAAVGHALLGTEDLVWRGGWPAWTLSALLAGAFLAAQALAARPARTAASSGGSGGVRAWLLAGPAVLLAGQLALSPAVWNAAASYRHGSPDFPGLGFPPEPGPALPVLAVGLFLVATFSRPPGWLGRVLWPAALLAGAALFAAGRPGWLGPAFLLAAGGLGGCLALADASPDTDTDMDTGTGSGPETGAGDGSTVPGRRGYAAVGGMLVFAVAAVAYYAAYDLGYPNGWVPVALAVLVAVVAAAGPPAATSVLTPTALAWTVIGLMLLTGVAAGIHRPLPAAEGGAAAAGGVRVVPYNTRMGFGLDGRLDLDGLARAVIGSRPDVVVLSEVDRGWLLNGRPARVR
nr:hypothetical protein [Micromonospora kangleipakensis]